MVRELKVEDPNEGKLKWEEEVEFLHDLVYFGIEIPEKMQALQRERLHWVPADRDARSVVAEKQWDSYHVWLGEKGGLADLTPRERLVLYASEGGK